MPEPLIYDAEEAVRFTAAWTGLAPKLVERVLTALERYLELAGLAEPFAPDPTLEAERAAWANFLPERPDRVDDRQLWYAARVTGLDLALVAAVARGETAYMDYTGLCGWSCESDREAALGGPAWA